MAEMLNNLEAPSDAELISRVRGGDVDAYGQLFARHVEAARRLARQLVRGPDSDDLVSEAFTKVMTALQSGGGPDIAFRAYLLTAVRRLHVDRIRVQARLTTSDDLSEFDPGVPFQDTVVEEFESGAAARAFATLPERWQMVLWHLEVERQKPADVAPLLGMTPNSVSALAYRAREGLRQAFLSAHLAEISDTECGWVVEHLGSYVRKGLSRRETVKVSEHLEGCRPCAARYLELQEVNSDLSGIIAPLLLGGLAAGYLAATGSGAAVGGVVALLDRAKDFVTAHVAPVAAGTTAAGVAAAVVIGGGVGSGGRSVDPGGAAAPPSQVSGAQPSDGVKTTGGRQQKAKRAGAAGPGPGSAADDEGAVTAPPSSDTSPGTQPSDTGEPQGDDAGDPPAATPDGPPDDSVVGTQPGPDEQPPSEPRTSEPPEPVEPESRDIALTLDGNYLSKGIGRFRTHVTNLPTASGPTPVQLTITFSRPEVHLDRIPSDCSYAGGGVSCTANGGTHNGLFDADMSALEAGEPVTITVHASIPDLPDPDPSDNTRSIELRRSAVGRLLAWG